MTKHAINDQILFDYGVTKAKATEDAARSFRKSAQGRGGGQYER